MPGLKVPIFENPFFEKWVPLTDELHKDLKVPDFEKPNWVFQKLVPLTQVLHKDLKVPTFGKGVSKSGYL